MPDISFIIEGQQGMGQYVKSCVKVQGLVELEMELASSAC